MQPVRWEQLINYQAHMTASFWIHLFKKSVEENSTIDNKDLTSITKFNC